MGKKKLLETRCSPCYIHDMMSHLKKTQADAKLEEIEAIGFGFVKQIPHWHVKQDIMVQLARSYDLGTSTLRVDVGNIRINAELIGQVFGIPSGGDDFPSHNDKNAAHVAIKRQFHRKTTTELRDFVYDCPMETEADRMEFRRHFILVVLKMFLCPTTQQVISPWHIPSILDVSNPRRFNWPLKIFKWLEKAIEKYKLKNNKTCEGCMFALLVLYFQRLKYGQLDNCQESESWIAAWTADELDKKATDVLSKKCIAAKEKKSEVRNDRERKTATKPPFEKAHSMHAGKTSVAPMGTVCLKCGDEGFPETLVFCNDCEACALHRYCLDGPVVFWEEVIWFCEDCEVKLVKPSSFNICVPASPENSDSISLENDVNKATKKLRNCINRVKKSNQQAHNIIEEWKLNRKISNQLAHKTVEEKHDKRQINNQEQQKIIEEEKLKKSEVISQQKQDLIEEEKQMKRNAIPDSFAKTKALLSDSYKRPLPEPTLGSNCTREDLDHRLYAQPIAKPIWRGSLNFRNEAGGIVTELLAHMSSLACSKVEEETQLLPKVLHADLLPRSVAWPKSFKYEGATDKSIALYFFPQSQRDEKAFDKLVDDIIQLELAIRVAAKNADLVIFPSTALPVQHRRVQAKYYLWGVFRGKQTSRKTNDAVSIADSGV